MSLSTFIFINAIIIYIQFCFIFPTPLFSSCFLILHYFIAFLLYGFRDKIDNKIYLLIFFLFLFSFNVSTLPITQSWYSEEVSFLLLLIVVVALLSLLGYLSGVHFHQESLAASSLIVHKLSFLLIIVVNIVIERRALLRLRHDIIEYLYKVANKSEQEIKHPISLKSRE